MNDFTFYILTAIAMVFVIEGLCYALFPDAIKKMMATALTMETTQFRQIGMVMAAFGVMIVWGLRIIAQ